MDWRCLRLWLQRPVRCVPENEAELERFLLESEAVPENEAEDFHDCFGICQRAALFSPPPVFPSSAGLAPPAPDNSAVPFSRLG